ncbi:hypothetical protein B5M44_25750 [Shinella sumterensis]|uniref:SGNH/GDSL hydrolase family protein n=1 Tax=Shinella sumterensis TaxID=1967501 RepID=UPI00106E1FB9|nr:SGNH/GDSL hydrolase family protein [Shinella sumterensis]MCD1265403.1 hydrolase [Shinella sumterensis]TFE93022.1 hypothetical protein B5M44_25750 [Shinella sumterensis]
MTMKTVLCFGDSNTWGTVPMTAWNADERFDSQVRWPGVLRQRLGADWHVIEEGLPGRTTVLDDPLEGRHLNGLDYLLPCLFSHRPLDRLVIMLGTNDLKDRFNLSAEEIGYFAIERLLQVVSASGCVRGGNQNVVIVCPPPVRRRGIFERIFAQAEPKSNALHVHMQAAAKNHRAQFLNAGRHVTSSDVDGIHLDADQQVRLGHAIADLFLAAHDDTPLIEPPTAFPADSTAEPGIPGGH